MLPGGLCNPARKGTMINPDSTYEWRRKGEHVISHDDDVEAFPRNLHSCHPVGVKNDPVTDSQRYIRVWSDEESAGRKLRQYFLSPFHISDKTTSHQSSAAPRDANDKDLSPNDPTVLRLPPHPFPTGHGLPRYPCRYIPSQNMHVLVPKRDAQNTRVAVLRARYSYATEAVASIAFLTRGRRLAATSAPTLLASGSPAAAGA